MHDGWYHYWTLRKVSTHHLYIGSSSFTDFKNTTGKNDWKRTGKVLKNCWGLESAISYCTMQLQVIKEKSMIAKIQYALHSTPQMLEGPTVLFPRNNLQIQEAFVRRRRPNDRRGQQSHFLMWSVPWCWGGTTNPQTLYIFLIWGRQRLSFCACKTGNSYSSRRKPNMQWLKMNYWDVQEHEILIHCKQKILSSIL